MSKLLSPYYSMLLLYFYLFRPSFSSHRTVGFHLQLELSIACKIATLQDRHDCHLLLFMHKQLLNTTLLKEKMVNTRLHSAPVFSTYKPNNEKARDNVMYKGAMD